MSHKVKITFVCLVALFLMGCGEDNGKRFSVYKGRGGWWAKIEGHACPLGAWQMRHGPYPFWWMAEL